ncbi:MAG TPA: hypothetical protein VN737_13800, partial [Bryobacteraceae bacterium]|nr:hypothetical protein [Bryobacteraceae bacterium]
LKDEHWPNPYLSSATQANTPGAGPTGVKMTGPYEYVAPKYWLQDHERGGAFGFNTETSPGPAIPELASLREMLPKEHLWPIDSFWNFASSEESVGHWYGRIGTRKLGPRIRCRMVKASALLPSQLPFEPVLSLHGKRYAVRKGQ